MNNHNVLLPAARLKKIDDLLQHVLGRQDKRENLTHTARGHGDWKRRPLPRRKAHKKHLALCLMTPTTGAARTNPKDANKYRHSPGDAHLHQRQQTRPHATVPHATMGRPVCPMAARAGGDWFVKPGAGQEKEVRQGSGRAALPTPMP